MAETKSSEIKTPFSDAICKPKAGGTSSGGGDQAAAPSTEGKEQMHTTKA